MENQGQTMKRLLFYIGILASHSIYTQATPIAHDMLEKAEELGEHGIQHIGHELAELGHALDTSIDAGATDSFEEASDSTGEESFVEDIIEAGL